MSFDLFMNDTCLPEVPPANKAHRYQATPNQQRPGGAQV